MFCELSCDAAMPLKVPPSVKLPAVVTVPVRVIPLTVPVPATLVTLPDEVKTSQDDPLYILLLLIVVLKYQSPTVTASPFKSTDRLGMF